MSTKDEVQERINSRLTIDANLLEGGFSQDIIGSVSYEIGNIYDTELIRIADRVFVATAEGEDLDNVGADYGLPRRQSSAAVVYLEITGLENSIVNNLVQAKYDNITYTVQEYARIGASGKVLVKAKCDILGSVGNVEANTITEFVTTYTGLTAVTNPEPAYDGFDVEDDETYRERLLIYLSEDATNANEAQYRQWAMSVTGVKKAVVQSAEIEGAGNVGVYIAAVGNIPVSQELIDEVKTYIEKIQPINATVIVNSLTYTDIDVDATVQLAAGYTTDDVAAELGVLLAEYLETVTTTVSYFRISELLYSCNGVEDVIDYTLNGGTDSITLENTDYAVMGEITIGT